MHCIMHTDVFERSAKEVGLTEDEIHEIEMRLSTDPTLGEIMPGTGGARKWRMATRHKGKRSGYRVISYYAADDIPVFLLDVLKKGERSTLTQAEKNGLRHYLGGIAEDYRADVKRKLARLQEKTAS